MNDHCPVMGRQNPAYGTLLLLFLLLFPFPTPAFAGYIALQVTPDFALRGEPAGELILDGKLVVKNDGNEMANRVRPMVRVGPFTWEGHPRDIDSGKVAIWDIREGKHQTGLTPGLYPVVFKVRYDDLNGFHFSNVQLYSTRFQVSDELVNRFPRFEVKLRPSQTGPGDYSVAVQVLNRAREAARGEVQFLLPDELSIDAEKKPVTLDPGGFSFEEFRIENRSGLPGSSYAVFGFFEWEEGGMHRFSSAADSLKIQARKPGQDWFVAGAIGSGVLAFALLALFLVPQAPQRGMAHEKVGEQRSVPSS